MVAESQEARIRTFVERLLPYWLLGTSVLFSAILLGARVGLVLVFGRAFGGAAPGAGGPHGRDELPWRCSTRARRS